MNYDPDIEELLGPATPAPEPRRPARSERAVRVLEELVGRGRRDRQDEDDATSFDLADMHAGVTVGWLSKVFGMDPSNVKKRLAECPPLHRRKAGYVYSLPQAAAYLVKPVFDADEYIRSMKPSELPNSLQKEYWDAMLKRQKWEENAGELWRTEAVIDVLGETFKTMKFQIQLWADGMERAVGLTDEQRTMLQGMTDALQRDLHKALVEDVAKRRTLSTLAEDKPDV